MKPYRTAIFAGIICTIMGVLIGGYIFTRIGFTYEYSGRTALLLSLRELIKANQNENAMHIIDNQVDANIEVFKSLKNQNVLGFYFFDPRTLSQTSKNIRAVSYNIKMEYETNGGKLTPESINYLNGIKSPF
jgi:hypothetical protein